MSHFQGSILNFRFVSIDIFMPRNFLFQLHQINFLGLNPMWALKISTWANEFKTSTSLERVLNLIVRE